ncbi:MAG: adenine phosphoribosyltransferase [bacterium]
MEDLKKSIRQVPDFPKEGILFYDITTLLSEPAAFQRVVDHLAERYEKNKPDRLVAIDARGFIFGGALSYVLGVGLTPVRKKGKLPWETVTASYELEYGLDEVEMHRDQVCSGERVVVIDDLLATGGTARAVAELVKQCGGEVMEYAFLIELDFLNGREKLGGFPVYSILHYSE